MKGNTMNTTIVAERPTRRGKPSEGGAIIQAAREDAGLSREELAKRWLLAEFYMRDFAGYGWGYRMPIDAESIRLWAYSLQKVERSRLREPDSTYLMDMLTLIEAGPQGTSDAEVVAHYAAFAKESLGIEMDSLREIGENFALAISRAKDDPQHLGALMVNFFDKTLQDVQRPHFTDPRYIKDARDVTLKAALEKLASI
jgi:hypothetical protein